MDVDLSIGAPETPQVRVDDGHQGDVDVPELFDEEVIDERVDEGTVRRGLRLAGRMLGGVVGDPDVDEHWRFTDDELDDLAPALTRYINRRPKLRAAVRHGDEAIIAAVLVEYAGRNLTAGKLAKEARRDDGDGEGGRAEGPPGDGGPGARRRAVPPGAGSPQAGPPVGGGQAR